MKVINKFSVSALSLLGLLLPAVAQAQTSQIQGALWLPNLTTDSDSLPHTHTSHMPGRWNWNAGLALEFLERPYVLRSTTATGSTARAVDFQVWTHVLANIGLASNVSVGLALPILTGQLGDVSPLGQSSLGVVAFGDVRANVRVSSRRVFTAQPPTAAQAGQPEAPRPDPFVNEGPGVAFVGTVSAPTGDPRSLSSIGAFTVEAAAAGDFRLFGMLLAANLGYRARFNGGYPGQAVDCTRVTASTPSAQCLGSVALHDQLTYNFGIRMPQGLLGGLMSLYMEGYGAIDMRNPAAANTQPFEMQLGVQKSVRQEWHFSFGGGAGLTDVPGNPRLRFLAMAQWAPRFIDDDGDGLRDNTGEDHCVGLPEDRDGFEDGDGCPEDNDQDPIPDDEDQCPTVNEDEDGFEDNDGCPDLDNDADGILDTEDQCRDVAAGTFPDETRRGCPSNDNDRDGVANATDQCVEVPRGEHEDPARSGCPLPDRDNDAVGDTVDACPDLPAGANATAAQRGCPDEDPDHDGVSGAADLCPTTLEDVNGVNDQDGCPDNAAPASTPPATPPTPPTARPATPARPRARVRVINATQDSPGEVELLEGVRFTTANAVSPQSAPLLDQLAIVLMATSRNPSKAWTLSVRATWVAPVVPTPVAPTAVAPRVVPPPVAPRGAITQAIATTRRDAVLAELRRRSVPEWALVVSDVLLPEPPAPRMPVTTPATATPRVRPVIDRGIVLRRR